MELDVIASVILGGCSLFGGRGFVLGTLLGSLIIGTLNNGLVLLGVSSSLQLVIKGAIIIAAVAFTRSKARTRSADISWCRKTAGPTANRRQKNGGNHETICTNLFDCALPPRLRAVDHP